jgi:hypothetical protein
MSLSARIPVQTAVILGFVISALASVISYVDTVTQRAYHFTGFKVIVLPLLNPLLMISVLIAWWWLTRVEAHDEGGAVILRRTFLAFAAQYFFTTILFLLIITPINAGDGFWLTTVTWFELIGAFVSTIGLILLSRTVMVRPPITEPAMELRA